MSYHLKNVLFLRFRLKQAVFSPFPTRWLTFDTFISQRARILDLKTLKNVLRLLHERLLASLPLKIHLSTLVHTSVLLSQKGWTWLNKRGHRGNPWSQRPILPARFHYDSLASLSFLLLHTYCCGTPSDIANSQGPHEDSRSRSSSEVPCGFGCSAFFLSCLPSETGTWFCSSALLQSHCMGSTSDFTTFERFPLPRLGRC
ncbi:hypothetical protein BDP81DRAFT_183161 [Colletotrichum phormii]|uniref:Uncharacterized protein n=1 Tax=Colletotrichum phormii TaxID=359342 RepID=A0AAJ0EGV7_9PEZI|nr:uncharacterized protein BDP81DRAFT_183161 [Colletotrichum phormii]KAK1639757.1 hypothetical protein BDP81DRAFT_183161 [Colletotrichum phormii]